ncbi:uncharacterized protein Tco025E_07603 [Trypanosoma conorhini]|uniref:Uncharacterized protein n=1 Tax=Trypanosoma conorhini TaxID=83891 RepID=A0A422NL89_9TRYP|nr:uncharacterized protein Tco025E_07603 [Trypanosoma conorhini]RNF06288.1 hypothetical protein Tco025E_07603 [Trypanosoma conorhini]
MRVTGSPEWKSPAVTSPRNLLSVFVRDGDADRFAAGQQPQQQQQQQDDACDGGYATNRTLFSYRTACLEEDGDAMAPDELVPREASVATTAAARQLHPQQQQQQQQQQQPSDAEAAPRAAQLSMLASAMPGDAQEDAQATTTTVAVADGVWSWTSCDGGRGRAGAAPRGAVATATASTPCRRWFCADETAERRARSATPRQPTTQRKQLRLSGDGAPDSLAACDPALPALSAVSRATSGVVTTTGRATATTVRPAETGKRGATVLNLNAAPFIPSRMGSR